MNLIFRYGKYLMQQVLRSGTLAALLMVISDAHGQTGTPSRPPVQGCTWEQRGNAAVGLTAWVQRCDFGTRKIELFFNANILFSRFSDGGAPQALIEIFKLLPNETHEKAMQRIFTAHTEHATAQRCVLSPYRENLPTTGVLRYTFVPNAAYQRELTAQADPNDIPEPPCGEWGVAPDGIQYFEVSSDVNVRKLLFVRVGQDEPLFDEKTLQLSTEKLLQKR